MGPITEEEGVKAVQDLLDRLRAGEIAAQDDLIRLVEKRYRERVHRQLQWKNPRVATFERSDDVLQHVFIRLLKFLRSESAKVPASAAEFERWLPLWVAMHLRFILTEMARKNLGTNDRGHLEYGAIHEDPVIDQTSGPGGQRAQVHELIGLLPEEMRRLIDLRYYLRSNDTEIAAQLGIGRGRVKTIARDALALLGKWLREGYRGNGHGSFEGPARDGTP